MIQLYEHQKEVIDKLKSGCILKGGVGSGKSITSLVFYFEKICNGKIKSVDNDWEEFKTPMDLYIITTARKRDDLEWLNECKLFMLGKNQEDNFGKVKVTVDSWNNISKYVDVENAFFIFDEQRIVSYGLWSKSFIKISRKNKWLVLTATPGDVWVDYAPIFIANNFYKNITEFREKHVIYDSYSKFPKIKSYRGIYNLLKCRDRITVEMIYTPKTLRIDIPIKVSFNEELVKTAWLNRWNIFENKPCKDKNAARHVTRKIIYSDQSRYQKVLDILKKHDKVIIFYNFNYELEILRNLYKDYNVAEHNGHKHEPIPKKDKWVYLVQYIAGAEGWNCIETNIVVFYSLNPSYKIFEQAKGRIDRVNTKYLSLHYYILISDSVIDEMTKRALSRKEKFNDLDVEKALDKYVGIA